MARLAVLLALMVTCSGCAVNQACKDHQRIRCCLLDLYTDQIMDNLVRASNGLPIIQIDYTELSATLTVDASANSEITDNVISTNLLALPLATLDLTRQVTSGLKATLTGKNTNQVVIRGSPVVTKDEVYNAYLEFLNESDTFFVTPEPPPPDAVHLVRCYRKLYYWVPNDPQAIRLFMRLALVTTSQRGQPLQAPEEFFTATIRNIEREDEDKTFPNNKLLTTVISTKVPSGAGKLVATIDSKAYRFSVLRYKGIPGALVSPGAKTDKIVIVADLDDPLLLELRGKDEKQLTVERLTSRITDAPIKLYLDDYRPQLRTTEDLLQGIQNRIEDLRINQLRVGIP